MHIKTTESIAKTKVKLAGYERNILLIKHDKFGDKHNNFAEKNIKFADEKKYFAAKRINLHAEKIHAV